jgi:hypothetical protein
MRFEIAIHAQRGRMGTDLSQQPTLDEKPQIVVNRGERNGWNAAPDGGVNVFRGMVSVGSDDSLIDHLTLMRDRQTVLRGQLTELFMGEAHDYRMRIIIKRSGAVSTEIFPVTSSRVLGNVTEFTPFDRLIAENVRATASTWGTEQVQVVKGVRWQHRLKRERLNLGRWA